MKAEIPKLDVIYQNEAFLISKHNYDLQFFPYYNARLEQMLPALTASSTEHWPNIPIHQVSDLADKKDDDDDDTESDTHSQASSSIDEEILQGKVVVVRGTLFKKMPRQPNILKELDDEKKMISPVEVDQIKFVSDQDVLYLQSNDGSIELKGEINVAELCTGICIAVKGHINPNGSGFIVEDICFPTIEAKLNRQPVLNDYHVALVSGLGFSKNMAKKETLTKSLRLLVDILTGKSSLVVNQPIVNLIIAGDLLSKNARNEEMDNDLDKKKPAWNKKVQSYTVEAVKLLDKFLTIVGQYMSIDVMPGSNDPCNYLWPQQPLHPALLPYAQRLDSIHSVPNPHRATYFGTEFLGTSGQNVDSVRSCTTFDDSIDIMRHMMEWCHLAPTSPDLLHSYPFSKVDPFTLDHYPDIFFAGNQKDFGVGTFQSQSGKKVQLISIPSFEEKTLIVLVNLRTLQCEMLAFD